MVETDGEEAGRQVYTADWTAIFERWRTGEDAASLADAFNLAQSTVTTRCRWIEKTFPGSGRLQMSFNLARRLEEAEAVLMQGGALDAERRAKAVFALIRAARALESWSMNDTETTAQIAGPTEDGLSDYEVSKAELERRLLRILDYKHRQDGRAREPAGGPAPDGQDGADRTDLGLADLGQTRSDPA